jgi:hypothetical protein
LWLIKVWFSASTFVVKIATFAKPETVSNPCAVNKTPIHRKKCGDYIKLILKIKINFLPLVKEMDYESD